MNSKYKKALNYILNDCFLESIPSKFLTLQKSLSSEERFLIRNDEKIASKIFNIDIENTIFNEYYCWDSTTLSLYYYLKEFLKTKNVKNILELGCGPYCTLSISLKKLFPNIEFTALEIDKDKIKNAIRTRQKNKIKVDIFYSDLFSEVNKKYDIIFMNPPYVPSKFEKQIVDNSNTGLNLKEWKSGHSNKDGLEVINNLLKNSKNYLSNDGFLIMGINNYFISNIKMISLFKNFGFNLFEKFKKQKECTPKGNYSQVYTLNMK